MSWLQTIGEKWGWGRFIRGFQKEAIQDGAFQWGESLTKWQGNSGGKWQGGQGSEWNTNAGEEWSEE